MSYGAEKIRLDVVRRQMHVDGNLLAAVRLLVSRGSSNDTEMCVCEPYYPTQQLLGTLNRDVVATL